MDINMFPDLPSKKQRVRDTQDPEAADLFSQAPAVQSTTSQESARQFDPKAIAKRRLDVYNIIHASGPDGRARFQIAHHLGKEQCDITSSVDALIRLGEIVELDRKALNPKSEKWCAILVAKCYARAA